MEYSSRNPESHSLLESGIQVALTWNPKSTAWDSESEHPRNDYLWLTKHWSKILKSPLAVKAFNPFTAKCGQRQNSTKNPKFHSVKFEKQVAPCESTGKKVLFEWSHHRILSTESKVTATLQNSIIHSGSERVKAGTSDKQPPNRPVFSELSDWVNVDSWYLHFSSLLPYSFQSNEISTVADQQPRASMLQIARSFPSLLLKYRPFRDTWRDWLIALTVFGKKFSKNFVSIIFA